MIRDPREPVYRKVGKRYVECGRIDTPYLKDRQGSWEGIRKDGLWLHTSGDGWRGMTFLSSLEDLPCSAVRLAAMHAKQDDLTKLIMVCNGQSMSVAELSKTILHFLATSPSGGSIP
jgi:hypothetical protein